jgi:hypothetical protein
MTTRQTSNAQESPASQQGIILQQISPAQESVNTQPTPSFDRIIPGQAIQPQYDIQLADIDVFDTNFSIDDAEIDAVILNSTQDFWAHFPGEVEMY